jgi:hypothetical protein
MKDLYLHRKDAKNAKEKQDLCFFVMIKMMFQTFLGFPWRSLRLCGANLLFELSQSRPPDTIYTPFKMSRTGQTPPNA